MLARLGGRSLYPGGSKKTKEPLPMEEHPKEKGGRGKDVHEPDYFQLPIHPARAQRGGGPQKGFFASDSQKRLRS